MASHCFGFLCTRLHSSTHAGAHTPFHLPTHPSDWTVGEMASRRQKENGPTTNTNTRRKSRRCRFDLQFLHCSVYFQDHFFHFNSCANMHGFNCIGQSKRSVFTLFLNWDPNHQWISDSFAVARRSIRRTKRISKVRKARGTTVYFYFSNSPNCLEKFRSRSWIFWKRATRRRRMTKPSTCSSSRIKEEPAAKYSTRAKKQQNINLSLNMGSVFFSQIRALNATDLKQSSSVISSAWVNPSNRAPLCRTTILPFFRTDMSPTAERRKRQKKRRSTLVSGQALPLEFR